MEKALFAKKDKLHNIVEVYLNHTSTYPMNSLNQLRMATKSPRGHACRRLNEIVYSPLEQAS